MIGNRVAYVARSQDGIITRTQALAAGMTTDAIRHATRKGGPWQPVLRGIYATFSGPLGDIHRLRAAILHSGPDAAITGPWACWMHGLTYGPPRGELVDTVIPGTSHRRSGGFVRVARSARGVEIDSHWFDEAAAGDVSISIARAYEPDDEISGAARPGVIPMVSAACAVVHTVTRPRWLPPDWQSSCVARNGCPHYLRTSHEVSALRNVRALMCEAVQRGACTVRDLVVEIRAAPRNNSAIARRVLDDVEAGCRSAPECELRDLIAGSAVLPSPRWNQPLPGVRGIYPDACWPEARLVVEVDSRAFHGFGDAPERTERRRARFASLGWTVLPVAPRRIREEPSNVLAEIEAAYLSGLARSARP
ncbi:type IV toxin-antitoxin system AbiEi family antitoxin domain-containing protein [Phytoactinopolyspora mesophila]|uniref:DUF559 domain-containing protein n=1 Tax=Phytoactinopolyspora mesophila TaxID=2650750 RepID=A0A7K3M6S0_9ACTN|nr:type IV toxin-antitoxin system AbiEi family antitoxin domain-containing protein [Phytoactinopolyspora mesophila]NDL58592.1 hypothetical protein [Phytoactinopolyspora mesophila]